eukprot:8319853-Alexandrium_andersonii.AAC.1
MLRAEPCQATMHIVKYTWCRIVLQGRAAEHAPGVPMQPGKRRKPYTDASNLPKSALSSFK